MIFFCEVFLVSSSSDIDISDWVLEPYFSFGPVSLVDPTLEDLIEIFGKPVHKMKFTNSAGNFTFFNTSSGEIHAWIIPKSQVKAVVIPYYHFKFVFRGKTYQLPKDPSGIRSWLSEHDPLSREIIIGDFKQFICPLLGILWDEDKQTLCFYAKSHMVHLMSPEAYHSASLEVLGDDDFSSKLFGMKKAQPELFSPTWAPLLNSVAKGALPHCQYGGSPLLEKNILPTCGICKKDIPLILQIDIEQFPELLKKRYGLKGILQFFMCLKESCVLTFGEPEDDGSTSYICRILQPEKLQPSKLSSINVLPAFYIVGWFEEPDGPLDEVLIKKLKPKQRKIFDDEEFLEMYQDYFPFVTDKFGGEPSWSQQEDILHCPICGKKKKPMQFLTQYRSDYDKKTFFGDGAKIHIFQCAVHKDQVRISIQ